MLCRAQDRKQSGEKKKTRTTAFSGSSRHFFLLPPTRPTGQTGKAERRPTARNLGYIRTWESEHTSRQFGPGKQRGEADQRLERHCSLKGAERAVAPPGGRGSCPEHRSGRARSTVHPGPRRPAQVARPAGGLRGRSSVITAADHGGKGARCAQSALLLGLLPASVGRRWPRHLRRTPRAGVDCRSSPARPVLRAAPAACGPRDCSFGPRFRSRDQTGTFSALSPFLARRNEQLGQQQRCRVPDAVRHDGGALEAAGWSRGAVVPRWAVVAGRLAASGGWAVWPGRCGRPCLRGNHLDGRQRGVA
eukprot:COSAG06_NODE_1300_length_9944_cov_248.353784_6_plen_305_part_00